MLGKRIKILKNAASEKLFDEITRGIEKENLRITLQGKISTARHPQDLGAALTNNWITTDFSEALVEVITPAEKNRQLTYDQLYQASQFVAQNVGTELIWPSSMPVELDGDSCIPLAEYGANNVGRMKKLYRKALCYRYGRAMQVIAGIHYNFSLPKAVFQLLQEEEKSTKDEKTFINNSYMHLVRNCLRYAWLIPYLFGASPACAETSVIRPVDFLKKFSEHGFYGPYATSLRLSDLGYKNKGEDLLNISFDNIIDYANSLIVATKRPYHEFEEIGLKENGEYKQLSTSLLQIANEYYSPIRPKQIANSFETPTHALLTRGIAYIEMRMLDLNPLQAIGICFKQMTFMDVFLTFCLLEDSPLLSYDEILVCHNNLKLVAAKGRDSTLKISVANSLVKFKEAANRLFEKLYQVAELLEYSASSAGFIESIQIQEKKLLNSELTPSARVLNELMQSKHSFQYYHLQKAIEHTATLQAKIPKLELFFREEAKRSLIEFEEIEQAPQKSFSEFLSCYL